MTSRGSNDQNPTRSSAAAVPERMSASIRARPCSLDPLHQRQFDDMRRAFSDHGGFMDIADVTARLRRQSDQPISRLARWILARTVLSISWRARTWMPAFQFQLADMSMQPVCTGVIAEFLGVLSDWEIALWYASPNVWLDGQAPVSLLVRDAGAVLQAARADRFVARA